MVKEVLCNNRITSISTESSNVKASVTHFSLQSNAPLRTTHHSDVTPASSVLRYLSAPVPTRVVIVPYFTHFCYFFLSYFFFKFP
jgi:hypothetical protein